MLTTQWQQQLKEQIGLNIFGTVPTLTQLFEQVMIFSESEHFSLVIDEFQDLESVNRSFFSTMQNIWDTYQNKSKIDIIVLNDIEKNAHIYEVKRQAKKLDMEILAQKADAFTPLIPGYSVAFHGLSMQDM